MLCASLYTRVSGRECAAGADMQFREQENAVEVIMASAAFSGSEGMLLRCSLRDGGMRCME